MTNESKTGKTREDVIAEILEHFHTHNDPYDCGRCRTGFYLESDGWC